MSSEEVSARSIAVVNQKGGVAKTTTCLNLGVALGRLGVTVLLVDLDPQANLTTLCGLELEHDDASILDVLLETVQIGSIVRKDVFENVDVLPANSSLHGFERKLEREVGQEFALRDALDAAYKVYDFVIIDNAPTRGLLLHNALIASQQYLVPTTLEFLSISGIGGVMKTVEQAKNYLKVDISCIGILPTKFDRRLGSQADAMEELKALYGETVFDSVIPSRTQVEWAANDCTSIVDAYPDNDVSLSYGKLAKEVTTRG